MNDLMLAVFLLMPLLIALGGWIVVQYNAKYVAAYDVERKRRIDEIDRLAAARRAGGDATGA